VDSHQLAGAHYRVAVGSAAALAALGLTACKSPSGEVTGQPEAPKSVTTGQLRPSASKSGNDGVLPKQFRIVSEGSLEECNRDGESVTCTTQLDPLPDNYESWTGSVTGTLSGLTLTGMSTVHEVFHQSGDPDCRTEQHRSGPVTYDFSLDGTVVRGEGLMNYDSTSSGSCPHSYSGQQWGGQGTGKWSPLP
jgi:hypothetical protein